MGAPTVPRSFYFPEISKEEVRETILREGNTAPGKDEVPIAILKYTWPLIESFVITLFIECLSLGYHPRHFAGLSLSSYRNPENQISEHPAHTG